MTDSTQPPSDGPGGFEEYLYDGDHVIAVLDDNQNVLRTFSYYPGVDKPHSVMTDTATYYYATDPTGSVIGLAEFDGAASVVNHYRYDVWGMPQGIETEGAENPIRFKARWWDPDTELLDFRSRWYDPEIGRFISEDPIGLAGGINVYRFVGNDPVGGQDPFGLSDPEPCDEDYDAETAMQGTFIGYDQYGVPMYDLQPIGVCVEGGAPGPPPLAPGPGIGPGGIATVSVSGTGGKGGGAIGGQSTPEPEYTDLNQCIIANAIPHYRGTIDVIHTPVTIQLQEGRGSVTVVPGALLTGGGSLIGNAMVARGAFQTGAVRGAPYAGPNGAPVRGGRFVAGVAGKFLKGVAAVQLAWHAALFAGSELVAAAECLSGG